MLDQRLTEALKKVHESLLQGGQLLSPERLDKCCALFKTRFGPDVLRKLQGDELLNLLHARPSKDSLVYWLEFKNDDEFPAKFGSIAGGSALKFGVYLRKETGVWMTGSSQDQKQVSVTEAIAIAAKQRDQLLSAVELLAKLPDNASDGEYGKLQEEMDKASPDVSAYAWGHKYLSLLFPSKLDDYHNAHYQRFYLLKLLQVPPTQSGLYASAGRYVQIAGELGMPINHLTTILNQRSLKPHPYWRIGTSLGEAESIWELMKNGNFVAIGWAELGNLADIPADQDLRGIIRQGLEKTYGMKPNVASRKAGEIRNFFGGISEGDFVLAADGKRIMGVGRVTGPYRFDPTSQPEAPHRRAVEWLTLDPWELPDIEGLRTTVVEISDAHNLVETERRVAFPSSSSGSTSKLIMSNQAPEALPLNIILYGPPGTGKTYRLRSEFMEKFFTDRQAVLNADEQASALVKDMAWWEVVAVALLDTKDHKASVSQILEHPLVRARLKLAANKHPRAMLWASLQSHTKKECPTVNYTTRIDPLLFSKDENSVWSIDATLAETEYELGQALQQFRNPTNEVPEVHRYKFTTFHQSFSYEDFVEGIKPQSDGGQLSYEVRDGIFKQACLEAAAIQPKPYALFIDEINRGNVASIFGELITLIEDDKRIGTENALTPELPYSRQPFGVPKNLHIIGTMNTADRSVEALDTALRRRFTFIEMRPDPGLIEQPASLDVDLRKLLGVMNARIEQLLDHDHCIGHAYFMSVKDIGILRTVFANKIIPLLREYFYGNPAKVGMVLGERFVLRQSTKNAFAAGTWGVDDLDEKEVFAFTDVSQFTETDFRSIYAEPHPGL